MLKTHEPFSHFLPELFSPRNHKNIYTRKVRHQLQKAFNDNIDSPNKDANTIKKQAAK